MRELWLESLIADAFKAVALVVPGDLANEILVRTEGLSPELRVTSGFAVSKGLIASHREHWKRSTFEATRVLASRSVLVRLFRSALTD